MAKNKFRHFCFFCRKKYVKFGEKFDIYFCYSTKYAKILLLKYIIVGDRNTNIMIVTVVCDVLGKENNGTTVAGMNLIRFLKKQGHTVRILCADQDKKGMDGVFVVPNLSFGKMINRYVSKGRYTCQTRQRCHQTSARWL